jgi:hypothetical protein
MKPEMIEGPQATENFERTMKKIFQVPKSAVVKAEKKAKRDRQKKNKG